MTAVRESIFAEVEQRLGAITGVLEVKRMPFVDPLLFPALHIFDAGQQIEETESGVTRYGAMLTVEGYLEAQGGAEAHAELSNLYSATVAALVTEPPLGGLAETIDEGGMNIQIAPLAGKSRLMFALDFTISFPTRRGAPSTSA